MKYALVVADEARPRDARSCAARRYWRCSDRLLLLADASRSPRSHRALARGSAAGAESRRRDALKFEIADRRARRVPARGRAQGRGGDAHGVRWTTARRRRLSSAGRGARASAFPPLGDLASTSPVGPDKRARSSAAVSTAPGARARRRGDGNACIETPRHAPPPRAWLVVDSVWTVSSDSWLSASGWTKHRSRARVLQTRAFVPRDAPRTDCCAKRAGRMARVPGARRAATR